MELKTFWSCNRDDCEKNYRSQRWGLKHLTTAHDGEAHLHDFTPDKQQKIIDDLLSEVQR